MPKMLGDGGGQRSVDLLYLISESEEPEENKHAKDGSPTGGLKRISRSRIQQVSGELEHTKVTS